MLFLLILLSCILWAYFHRKCSHTTDMQALSRLKIFLDLFRIVSIVLLVILILFAAVALFLD